MNMLATTERLNDHPLITRRSIRILHVLSCPASGGAEIYVKDLSRMMVELGHEIMIAFVSTAEEVGREREFETEFLSELSEAGIQYAFIGHDARTNLLYGGIRLRKIVKHFDPDVIHSHLYQGLAFAFMSPGKPLLYTHHNIKLKLPPYAYRLLDLRVDCYVGICEACEKLLKSVSRRQVITINNGVNVNRLSSKTSIVSNLSPRILLVGRLSEQKNLTLFFSSLRYLGDLDFTVTVAGDGKLRGELENYVQTMGLADRVEFLGNVSNIPELLSRADIFAMSSAWEGLPIALIEATLSGLPVVVTDVGGCAEVVHACRNGVVVGDATPGRYAAALRRLLESPRWRASLSRNALEHSTKYRLDSAVASHMSTYFSLLPTKA